MRLQVAGYGMQDASRVTSDEKQLNGFKKLNELNEARRLARNSKSTCGQGSRGNFSEDKEEKKDATKERLLEFDGELIKAHVESRKKVAGVLIADIGAKTNAGSRSEVINAEAVGVVGHDA